MEFKKFLIKMNGQAPRGLDVQFDCAGGANYRTHKRPTVVSRRVRHPRFTMYFTPAYLSSIGRVEPLFGEVTWNWSSAAIAEVCRRWRNFCVTGQGDEIPTPSIWMKTVEKILGTLGQLLKQVSGTGH